MNERFRIVNALVLASAALVSVSSVRAQEGTWIDAQQVEGINTSKNENAPGISGDGLTMYFNSSPPKSDIWVARRASPEAPFDPAVKLEGEVNTKHWSEAFPRVSADGLTLYFSSNRPGGEGGDDIYKATRATPEDEFGDVVNMGPEINSSERDSTASVSDDHLIMVFSSGRPGGFGVGDLYMATRATTSVEFSNVVNLGPPVNTESFEYNPSISGDGLAVFFSFVLLESATSANVRLYMTQRDSLEDSFGEPVPLDGPLDGEINMADANAAHPDVSREWPTDGAKIYFASTDRAGGSGAIDIWEATWSAGPPATETSCTNGVDDDGDGDIDCADSDCPLVSTETNCSNGVDDDCDGLVDCADSDCSVDADGDGFYAGPCGLDCDDSAPLVNPDATELCDDGIDNNCDGLVDCDDEATCFIDAACDVPSCGGNKAPCNDDEDCCSRNCGNNGKCKGGGGGAGSVSFFIRGDANSDGAVGISDPVFLLEHLFAGGPVPPCRDAADSNDDGSLGLDDAIHSLLFLFDAGPSLPPPSTEPGFDPTPDALDCSL